MYYSDQWSSKSISANELHASIFLPSLTLTSNSKTRSCLEDSRQRLSHGGSITQSGGSVLISLVEKLSTDRGATLILAIWNLLPLLQGSAVFSMPYTVVKGGYMTLLFIAIMSLMADVTGLILTDCLYEVSPRSGIRKRVRKDYVDIARTVWGNHGARLLNVILVFYLFTGDVVNILLLGKSIYDVLSPVTSLSFASLTAIFSVLAYPTLFITRLTILAYLSMLSVFSIMIGIVAVIVVFILQSSVWMENIKTIPMFDMEGFPLAMSIVMFSCLTHSVLPQVEGNMADASKCPRAVHNSYFSSAILKIIVAFLGAITFGSTTQSIITLNVGSANTIARIICAVALIGFAIFNYPLNMFVVCETMDNLVEDTKIGKENKYYYPWLFITRLILVVVSVVVALVLPYFGILLAVRGSLIGTCLIFVFPCYFHLKLKWKKLSNFQRFVDILLIIIGTLVGSTGLYASVKALVIAVQTGSG